MKKIINLLIIFFCVITLSGCGNKETNAEKRTIILNVDSDVVPEFTSNFGTGSYDNQNKVYTHTIDCIKDLYIYLNYDNLKTLTVHIPTSEMEDETIVKDVTFGQQLDVEVEITVDGVKKLEGLQISNSLEYTNLIIGNKNSFKITLPSRKKDYNIQFTLPGYKQFDINLEKENLTSGIAKVNAVAMTNEQMYIGFNGNVYSYKIYSMTTNKEIAAKEVWNIDAHTEFVLVPSNDSYYVKTTDAYSFSQLYKVNQGEDVIINLQVNKQYFSDHFGLYVSQINELYDELVVYDKTKNTLSYSTSIYSSLENTGLLVKTYEGKWMYMDSLEGKVTIDEYNYGHYMYILNYDDFEEVRFNVTKIDTKTNQVVFSGIQEDIEIYYNQNTYAEYENNIFTLTIYAIERGTVSVDLYNMENQFVGTIEKEIYPQFNGDIILGNISYDDGTVTRNIPYEFPMFLDDLVFDGEKYTYPSQKIDTNVSYVEIILVDEDGYVQTLDYLSNPYLLDDEYNIITGTEGNYTVYFALEINKSYTLHYLSETYNITVSQKNIETGKLYIIHEDAPLLNIKVPEGHTVTLNDYPGLNLNDDLNNIITIPKNKYGMYLGGSLTNGYATIDFNYYIAENVAEYELYSFYVFDGGDIEDEYSTYYVKTILGSNGVEYIYLERTTSDLGVSTLLKTSINQIYVGGNESDYYISRNDFVYNEGLKAKYYDMESVFDHVIIFEDYSSISSCEWSQNYYYYYDFDEDVEKGYVNNNTTVIFEYEYYGDAVASYTFTNSDSKYVEMYLDQTDLPMEFVVTQINK